jgi:hypothetical protein
MFLIFQTNQKKKQVQHEAISTKYILEIRSTRPKKIYIYSYKTPTSPHTTYSKHGSIQHAPPLFNTHHLPTLILLNTPIHSRLCLS